MLLTILTTKNPNLIYFKWLLILAIIMSVFLIYKIFYITPYNTYEGFTQKEPFIIKNNEDAYDTFYLQLYETLHDVFQRQDNELKHIIQTTNPCNKNSTILDVGSGTGHAVSLLQEEGYNVFGIDKSQKMCEYAINYNENIEVLNDDVLKPMVFEKNSFTHILCTYFTIYHFEDKRLFFRNCYFWMKPGGYLVVHLVDKNKFSNIIPHHLARSWRTHPEYNHISLKTKAIFNDFEYTGCFAMYENSAGTTFTETMTDLETKHIRQNEFDLYIEDMETICECAKQCGFIFHAKTDMKQMNNDENQYLYYFERPL
tara:strand:- start:6329 stop:7267 length:939 start_codon:yes stop_codon:yes gene_type:complete